MVRFGAEIYRTVQFGAVPRSMFLNGAPPLSVGKTVPNRLFSMVQRMNKPYKTGVSYGSRAFPRNTNETAVFLLVLYGAPYY